MTTKLKTPWKIRSMFRKTSKESAPKPLEASEKLKFEKEVCELTNEIDKLHKEVVFWKEKALNFKRFHL